MAFSLVARYCHLKQKDLLLLRILFLVCGLAGMSAHIGSNIRDSLALRRSFFLFGYIYTNPFCFAQCEEHCAVLFLHRASGQDVPIGLDTRTERLSALRTVLIKPLWVLRNGAKTRPFLAQVMVYGPLMGVFEKSSINPGA